MCLLSEMQYILRSFFVSISLNLFLDVHKSLPSLNHMYCFMFLLTYACALFRVAVLCVLVLVAGWGLSMLSYVFSEWNVSKILEMSHLGETCPAGLSKAASPHTLFSFPVHFSLSP